MTLGGKTKNSKKINLLDKNLFFKPLVILGPQCAGKTTLINYLKHNKPEYYAHVLAYTDREHFFKDETEFHDYVRAPANEPSFFDQQFMDGVQIEEGGETSSKDRPQSSLDVGTGTLGMGNKWLLTYKFDSSYGSMVGLTSSGMYTKSKKKHVTTGIKADQVKFH